MKNSVQTESLSVRLFILLAIGLSTGGPRLWRDPATVIEIGGFAYIAIFSFSLLVIGIPVLFCELIIGRNGKTSNPVKNIQKLALQSNRSKHWGLMGYMGALCGLLTAALVCWVCNWCIIYMGLYLNGSFADLREDQAFELFISVYSPNLLSFLTVVFIGFLSFLVLRLNTKFRFEIVYKTMIQTMLALIFVLMIYALVAGKIFSTNIVSQAELMGVNGTELAINTFETIDFSGVDFYNFQTIVISAFNSVSVGFFVLAGLSVYLNNDSNFYGISVKSGFSAFFIVQFISVALLPLILMSELVQPGAMLWFVQLPITLMELPGGKIIGLIASFIAILTMLSSSLLLMEPAVNIVEDRFNFSRNRAAIIASLLLVVLAASCVYSEFAQEFIDIFTSSILIPMVVFAMVLFVVWRLPKAHFLEAIPKRQPAEKTKFNPLAVPGVVTVLGTILGFVVSKILAVVLSQEQETIPVIVFAILFAISIFWDVLSWVRRPVKPNVRPMVITIIRFWMIYIVPILMAYVLLYNIWFYFDF